MIVTTSDYDRWAAARRDGDDGMDAASVLDSEALDRTLLLSAHHLSEATTAAVKSKAQSAAASRSHHKKSTTPLIY